MAHVFTLRLLIAMSMALLTGCATLTGSADADSDAPDAAWNRTMAPSQAPSYDAALKTWRDASDVNAWIGARFEYDEERAIRLSETQRAAGGRMAIHAPAAFYALPRGVCVDLARFAVETLRAIDPQSKPRYVMIEFDPIEIAGNVLRRHWVVAFEHDGKDYFFADSKRPGHIAGPYRDTDEFIADYARYRKRTLVSYRELGSFERTRRAMKARQSPDIRP